MLFSTLFKNYYNNSLLHKAKGTCEYERAKIKRLLFVLNEMEVEDNLAI